MTRSEAIDMLRQICSYLTAGNPVWRIEPIREACEMAIEALTEKEASAERRGKWIKMSDADGVYWACSECGEDIPRVPHYDPQFDLFPRLESIEKTNFCPNCGTKMEGDE